MKLLILWTNFCNQTFWLQLTLSNRENNGYSLINTIAPILPLVPDTTSILERDAAIVIDIDIYEGTTTKSMAVVDLVASNTNRKCGSNDSGSGRECCIDERSWERRGGGSSGSSRDELGEKESPKREKEKGRVREKGSMVSGKGIWRDTPKRSQRRDRERHRETKIGFFPGR